MPASTPDRFLLTGCASGIGRHLANELLQRGHRVLATDLDLEALERYAARAGWPERGHVRQLDVCDPEAWQQALDAAESAWGGLDVLLNVAGIIRPALAAEVTIDDVHHHFDINAKGVVFGTRAAARPMIERGAGHIINIASLASLAPIPGISLYSASKYAVRAFSLAAAEELRPHGVAVTVVCPDAVATPMLDLQLDYPEAALTFTAPKELQVEDLSRAILGRVLQRRPLIVTLPRWRGWLARLGDLSPRSARLLAKILQRQGLRKQDALRQSARDGSDGI
ncbi:MAG: SDR family oxidoreductase [Acidobacteriota bacterium]